MVRKRADNIVASTGIGGAVGGGSSELPTDPPSVTPTTADSRESLAVLPGLLALGQLMSESRDEELILRFASSSVKSFGPFQLVGIHLSGIGWYEAASRKPSL